MSWDYVSTLLDNNFHNFKKWIRSETGYIQLRKEHWVAIEDY